MRRRLFAVVVFLLGAVALAQEPQVLLDRQEMLSASKEATRERFPNAEEVVVGQEIHVTYNADGTYVQWQEEYLKILTEKAKRSHKVLSSWFTIPYQHKADCTIPLAEIIKPDGRVATIDAAAESKVVSDSSDMSSNIYNPNDKIRRVPLPGLEAGDVLHYVMYDRIVQTRMKNTFNDWFSFESTAPIMYSAVEVVGPQETPLAKIAVKDEVPGTLTRFEPDVQDGKIRYRWEARDVPRMFPEPGMPAQYMVVQRLLVSTSPDWEHVSRWYWSVSEPHYEPTEAMQEKVAELVRGIDDEQKRMETVFYYVAKEIRYLGITMESESPGYEPHDVKATFENKHGVCRDKAALLVVMLRLGGFQAFPVLIHNGEKRDPEVPQPYFNHAVVAARGDDGAYTLMDPTDDTTKELFPSYLNDKSYLVATPEGETLLTSPIIPAEENLLVIETTGAVDEEGTLSMRSRLTFEGGNDNFIRGYLASIKPSERRRVFEGLIREGAPGARMTDLRIEPRDMRDTTKTLEVTLAYEADDALITGDGLAMFPIPRIGSRLGAVHYVLSGTALEKRRYPMKIPMACGVRSQIEIALPPSLAEPVSLPAYDTVDNDSILWRQSLAMTEGTLSGRSDFQLKVVELSPEDYLTLKETLKQIEYDRKRMPILGRRERPGEEGVDAVVLDERIEYELADGHNWTVTRAVREKITSQAGIKNYSELKFHYNPAWEEITIEEGAVIGADGQARQINREEEINILDASWAGAAPRYPAGKIMIASLPGVDVGATVSYKVVRKLKGRPMFAMRALFRRSEPIQRKVVRLSAPRGLKVRVFLVDGMDQAHNIVRRKLSSDAVRGTRSEEGGRVIYEWTSLDAERIESERNLPPLHAFTPMVFASSGSWKRYARDLRKTLTAAASGQEKSEIKARELAGDVKDPFEKLTRIRDFVAVQVSAAGPTLPDLPLSAVTPADRTLQDGYGNTTDRAVLLHAMVKAAGFKPEFVPVWWSPLVEAFQKPTLDSPNDGILSNVLVRVRHNGRTVYLNDTDQYDHLGVTPHEGRLGLVLKHGKLETIDVPDELRDRSEVSYVIRLEDNGDALVTKTSIFRGGSFGAKKKYFEELPPEDRRRYHLTVVAAISKAAKAEGDLVTDFAGYPGVESFTARAARFAVRDEKHLYLELPAGLSGLFNLRSDTRTNPFYINAPEHVSVTTAIILPERMCRPLLAPAQKEWRMPGGAGVITSECRHLAPGDSGLPDHPAVREALEAGRHVLWIQKKAVLDPAAYGADDYPRIRDIDSALDHPGAAMVLLGEAPPPIDQ